MTAERPTASLIIVGDVGGEAFHVGDEAMLLANLEVLRRHDAARRFTVIGQAGKAIPDRYDAATLSMPRTQSLRGIQASKEVIVALKGASGLFVSGGGNLCSTWPALLYQRILLIREAVRLGVPVVMGGQTIGPELFTSERSALADVLAGVEHIGVRELPSAALALQMGLSPDRVHYQPDDAFWLSGRPPAEKFMDDLEKPFLAVTLDQSFIHQPDGLSSLASQFARITAHAGLQFVFIPHLGPLGNVGYEDGRVGTELCQLLRQESIICTLLPVMSAEATVWITQRAAAVVSSRYHPLVFATAARVPCLGIYPDTYARIKLQGALAHVGMANWCMSAGAARDGGLEETFRRLWARREELRAGMADARALLEIQEKMRWQRVLRRLGWATRTSEAPDTNLLGWPPDQLAAATLSALALERQASDEGSSQLSIGAERQSQQSQTPQVENRSRFLNQFLRRR